MAAAAALAAGGCGGSGHGGSASTPGAAGTAGATTTASATAPAGGTAAAAALDACRLLTPDDVQAVTGDVAGSLSSTLEDAVGRDPSQCSYPLASDGQPLVVSLLIRQLGSAGQAADQQQAARSGLGSIAGSPVEEVPNLGDAAFWVGGTVDQLHVRRGSTILILTAQLDKEPRRAAQLLAGRALARLAAPRAAKP